MSNKKRKRTSSSSSTRTYKRQKKGAAFEEIVRLLNRLDWSSVQNTGRRNVIGEDAPRNAKGKPYCQSLVLGRSVKGDEETFFTMENRELFQALSRLMRSHDEEFDFTSITVNKNLRCKPHRDRCNSGKSYIIGFGDYSGGELFVGKRNADQDKEARSNFTKLDLKNRFVSFFGGEQTHFTAPFTGERYTCVFYKYCTEEKARKIQRKAVMAEEAPSESIQQKFTAMRNKLRKKVRLRG